MPSGTTDDLRGIWGSGPNDLWAVGDKDNGSSVPATVNVFHSDGIRWSEVADKTNDGELYAVWGSGPDDVWAVGNAIERWDGTTWTMIDSGNLGYPSLNGVWGSGPNDVWAAGADDNGQGEIAHWNGNAWSVSATSSGWSNLAAVWGSGPDDAYAVGNDTSGGALFLRWNGTSWSPEPVPTSPFPGLPGDIPDALWGSGPDDIWGVGSGLDHWDGSRWAHRGGLVGGSFPLYGVWGSGATDIWAVGDSGTIGHYDGTAWVKATSGTTETLYGVWGTGPGHAWVVGAGGTILMLVSSIDEPPTVALTTPASGATVSGTVELSATASDDIGIASVQFTASGQTVATDESAPYQMGWNTCTVPDGTVTIAATATEAGKGQTATDSRTVTVDNAAVAPYLAGTPGDGKATLSWTTECGAASQATFQIYWATSPGVTTASQVVSAASSPYVQSSLTNGQTYYYRVAMVSGSGVGALSNEVAVTPGTFDATTWSSSTQGSEDLHGVWGAGPSDIWTVGNAGTVLHYDGQAWTTQASSTSADLRGVWGSGPADVWAVGLVGSTCSSGQQCHDITGQGNYECVDPSTSNGVPANAPTCTQAQGWACPSGESCFGPKGATSGFCFAACTISASATVLHWDGSAWSSVSGGTPSDLHAVWGSGPNDVWAVGGTYDANFNDLTGTIVHWDGSTWQSVDSGTNNVLNGVWGTGPNDVWAVGDSATILHWDGTKWSGSTGGDFLTGVWGSGSKDVWTVGAVGLAIHWDGTAWSKVPSWTSNELLGVWGSGPSDVWAVGDSGTLLRWDGQQWSPQDSATQAPLFGVWGAGLGDVWAVGAGGTIIHSTVAPDAPPQVAITAPTVGTAVSGTVEITANASDDVGVTKVEIGAGDQTLATFGSAPYVVQWDTCKVADGPVTLTATATDTVGQTGTNSVQVVVDNSAPPVLTGTAGEGTATLTWTTGSCGTPPSSFNLYWSTATGVTTSSTLVAGVTNPSLQTGLTDGHAYYYRVAAVVNGVVGPLSNEVSVTPQPLMRPSWVSVASGTTSWLNGVWGSGPSDLWAVGGGYSQGVLTGTILHGDDSGWSPATIPATTAQLHGVWGSGPNDVWVVGAAGDDSSGVILHWNGSAWSQDTSETASALFGIWGSGANDVYAVGRDAGDHGVILHWNGQAWSSATLPSGTVDLASVWGSGPNDVWAVGRSALHWDGGAWSDETSSFAGGLGAGGCAAIWGSQSDDVYLADSSSFHWNGSKWSMIPALDASNPWGLAACGVWGSGTSDVWVVGAQGMTAHLDGGYFSAVASGTTNNLNGVWGSGPGNVWVVGDEGTILHKVTVADLPPTVTITAPPSSATVSGAVTLSATASDDVRVASVRFTAAGSGVATLTDSPYTTTWDTCGLPDGPATIVAEATDDAGQTATDSRTVTIANAAVPPVLSGGAGDAKASLEWTTCGPKPDSFDLYWASAPGVTTSSTVVASATSPYTMTGLADGQSYYFRVAAVRGGVVGVLSNEVEVTPSKPLCGAGAWCWSNPRPEGNKLRAIAGSAANDVWAVGDAGTIVHWNGTAWANVISGTTNDLYSVSASSPNNAWAVGAGGTIDHWNGMTWSVTTIDTYGSTLVGVWSSDSNHVWAIVGRGDLYFWNGQSWSDPDTVSTSGLNFLSGTSIWGSGPNDIWAADTNEGFTHFDGTTWSRIGSNKLAYAGGSGPSDVWTVGSGGAVAHWNGTAWSSSTSGTTNDLAGIWASSTSDAWAVGAGGTMVHWDGSAWAGAAGGTTADLLGVWGSGSGDVWAVGTAGTIVHWNGTSWTGASGGASNNLNAVWGSGSGDAWAVGDAGSMLHWNGDAWLVVPRMTSANLEAVSGSGPSDVWAVGGTKDSAGNDIGGTALHWDGHAWSNVSTGASGVLNGVWDSGLGDVWAVGDYGTVVHWNGGVWSRVAALGDPLYGIWASGSNALWAVGGVPQEWGESGSSDILQGNGAFWSSMTSPSSMSLKAVRGDGPDDVWAVGGYDYNVPTVGDQEGQALLHWNGSAWSSASTGSSMPLYGVWSSAADDAWAVGGSGTMLHYDGQSWSAVSSGATADLRGIWGSSSKDVWVVGKNGTILHWDGSGFALPGPHVKLTSPTAGSTVYGQKIQLSADTSADTADGLSIAKVQFQVGGSTVATMTTAPFVTTWNGCQTSDGPITVTVTVTDTLGRTATDTAQVTLANSNAPAMLSGTPGDTTATLTWTDVCGGPVGDFTGDVYWSTSPGVTTSSSVLSNVSDPYMQSGLTNGQTYYYRVQSFTNGTPFGQMSNEVAVTPEGWYAPWSTAVTATTTGAPDAEAVWGSGPNDVWIGGTRGTLLHWDGSAWTNVPSGTTNTLRAIWGSGPSDVWAVGDSGTALHWDGAAWSAAAVPTVAGADGPSDLSSVWVDGPTDAWAVGIASQYPYGVPALLHWDGQSWTNQAPPAGLAALSEASLKSIWGSGPNDVWVVATFSGGNDSDDIFHYDGTSWSTAASIPANYGLVSLWGSGADDVWATGDGITLHWDGTSWTAVTLPSPLTYVTFDAISCSGASDVWMVGRSTGYGNVAHFDGSTWSMIASGSTANLNAVWATGPAEAWAVGDSGTIVHWNGTAWSTIAWPIPAWTAGGLNAVWGSGPGDAWAVGDGGGIAHLSGTTWSPVISGTTQKLRGVWGNDSADVWAVGDNGTILRWDGQAWSAVTGGTTNYLYGIWGNAPTDVWAVGGDPGANGANWTGTILHFDGNSWSAASIPATPGHFNAAWGSGADDVWAVGSGGAVLHWNGSSWSSIESGTTNELYGIWVSGPSDVWVAANTSALHWDGQSWSPATIPAGLSGIRAVWGSGANDVWTMSNSFVLHWDGRAWIEASSVGASVIVNGIWGSGPNDVWGVGVAYGGDYGSTPYETILHFPPGP